MHGGKDRRGIDQQGSHFVVAVQRVNDDCNGEDDQQQVAAITKCGQGPRSETRRSRCDRSHNAQVYQSQHPGIQQIRLVLDVENSMTASQNSFRSPVRGVILCWGGSAVFAIIHLGKGQDFLARTSSRRVGDLIKYVYVHC